MANQSLQVRLETREGIPEDVSGGKFLYWLASCNLSAQISEPLSQTMKRLALAALLLTPGCAYFCSNTCQHAIDANGKPLVTYTHMRVGTMFDANSSLAKARNSPSITLTNDHSAGTMIGGLNQDSTATNAVAMLQALSQILGQIAAGAAAGAK